MPELKDLINGYIASHNLVNPNDQAYINIDTLLKSTIASKNSTEELEFMKRDQLTRRLIDKLQPWHEINIEGKEPITKCVPPRSFFAGADCYAGRGRSKRSR